MVSFFGICIGVDSKEEIRFVSTGLSFFVLDFKQEEKGEWILISDWYRFEHRFITCQFLTFLKPFGSRAPSGAGAVDGECVWLLCSSSHWGLDPRRVKHAVYMKIKNKEESICREFLGFSFEKLNSIFGETSLFCFVFKTVHYNMSYYHIRNKSELKWSSWFNNSSGSVHLWTTCHWAGGPLTALFLGAVLTSLEGRSPSVSPRGVFTTFALHRPLVVALPKLQVICAVRIMSKSKVLFFIVLKRHGACQQTGGLKLRLHPFLAFLPWTD